MDDMNKELNNCETEENVTQPEVTENPSAELNPEVVEEVTVNPVPEPQTEPIVDETKYDPNGAGDEMPYVAPDSYVRNEADVQEPAGGQMDYTQSGTAQGSYNNQANAGGQTCYTQPGAVQGSYNQANAGGQTGYTQPDAAQGSYNQANTDGQGGYGRPNNYGTSQYDPNRAGRRPDHYGQNANYGQSIHHNPNRMHQDQYSGHGQKNMYDQGDSHGQRNPERRNAAPGSEYKSRFSNDGYGKGRTGYSSSYDSYRFETPVDPAPIEPGEAQYTRKKKKAEHKAKTENKITGKKIGFIAGIAALFGLVAAIVFLGITALFGNKVQEAPSRNNGGSIAAPTPSIILGEPDEDTSVASAGTSDATATVVELTVPQVVQQCMPSMVAITNTTIEEYRDFFGGRSTQESVSAGSGIIVGETETELLIATNNHVIQNSKDITVTFIDESAITGSIKGMDSDNDLAIVAVKLDDISQET